MRQGSKAHATLPIVLQAKNSVRVRCETLWHMPHGSLLLTPLPAAATSALCFETLLQAFQSQLTLVLAIILVLFAISCLSLRVGLLLHGLTTASSSTSSYLRWRCTPHYPANSRQYSLQPRAPKTYSCVPYCPSTLMQDFCYRNELLAIGIALANSVNLQEQINNT